MHPLFDAQRQIHRTDSQRRLARAYLRVDKQVAFLERRGEQAQPAYQVLKRERDELAYLLRNDL